MAADQPRIGSFIREALARQGEPYHWGDVGPSRTSAVVPVSRTVLDDWSGVNLYDLILQSMRRQAQDRHRMAVLRDTNPGAWARIRRLRELRSLVIRMAEEREREARRCPTCGCDPEEHGRGAYD